jgi:ATP-binding cassette, subfamily B, heavy metal transporter
MPRATTTVTSADRTTPPASGFQTIARVLPYLWPEGQGWVKRRVVLAIVMLVVSKLIAVTTPYLYKVAVDALTGTTLDAGTLLAVGAIGLTVAYGMARFASVAFGELRDLVFVRVSGRCGLWRWRHSPIFTDCRCAITSRAKPGG